jgi:hypothetical protein
LKHGGTRTATLGQGTISVPVGTHPDIENFNHEKPNHTSFKQHTMVAGKGNDDFRRVRQARNPMKRCSHTVLRVPANSSNANRGILLALDGLCLEQPALPDVLKLCRSNGSRLDILLLNSPKPVTLMLGKLLQQLEREGIDYRLSSGEGTLADAVPAYLHRFKYISWVLINCFDKWDTRLHAMLDTLNLDGYKVLTRLASDRTAPP